MKLCADKTGEYKLYWENRGIGVTQAQQSDAITKKVIHYTTKHENEQENIEYLPGIILFVYNTPIQSSPLLDECGYTGDTLAVDEMTAGTYIPPLDTNKHTKMFLQCVKRPAHVPEP